MSSRSNFPTEVYSTDCRLSQSDSVWEAVAKPKPKLSNSGKREVDKHPVIKKQEVTTSSLRLVTMSACIVVDWLVSMCPVIL